MTVILNGFSYVTLNMIRDSFSNSAAVFSENGCYD